jgi:hypothetical protein
VGRGREGLPPILIQRDLEGDEDIGGQGSLLGTLQRNQGGRREWTGKGEGEGGKEEGVDGKGRGREEGEGGRREEGGGRGRGTREA